MDAIQLLIDDHNAVKEKFAQFEHIDNLNNADEKVTLANEICTALATHMAIEEELFYPAARALFDDKDDALVDDAVKEHKHARSLMKDIQTLEVGVRLNLEMKALRLMIEDHVKDEEGTMFPKLREQGMETTELGEKMAQRKKELAPNV